MQEGANWSILLQALVMTESGVRVIWSSVAYLVDLLLWDSIPIKRNTPEAKRLTFLILHVETKWLTHYRNYWSPKRSKWHWASPDQTTLGRTDRASAWTARLKTLPSNGITKIAKTTFVRTSAISSMPTTTRFFSRHSVASRFTNTSPKPGQPSQIGSS